MRKYAIPTTFAVAAATLVVPFAQPAFSDEAAKPAEKCSITVESGTLDWGVKQSFRRYISGGIANGQWTTTGAVTEHGENKKGKDFFFQFQVDPAKSTITFDESGNVTAADIRTQDAAVDFEGHKGALASHIGSPYLTTTGTDAKIGINYRGYYVKAKEWQSTSQKTGFLRICLKALITWLVVLQPQQWTVITSPSKPAV